MDIAKEIRNAKAKCLYEDLMGRKKLPHYCRIKDKGENMALIEVLIFGYWKPRIVLNHDEKCAFEFLDGNERFTNVSKEDIMWKTLRGFSAEAWERARDFSAHFPTMIGSFENGVALVSWQLNPDGRYYMDDDGYGMTADDEMEIYGFINKNCDVVQKFRAIKNINELKVMRRMAELEEEQIRYWKLKHSVQI